jgi:hypothetical protein
LELVPDLPFSRRHTHEQSAQTTSATGSGRDETRGELRLRVLNSLPRLHQQYLFEEIRKQCSKFLRSKSVSGSEISVEELLSEVWKKLLGSVSIQEQRTVPTFEETSIDPHAPDRDGRVIWLLREVGGFEAMSHRYEDILRLRFGRALPEGGRPWVQPNGDIDIIDIPEQSTETPPEEVTRLIWIGLFKLAATRFPPEDDVSMLLQLFQISPDLFDEAASGQWPVNEIVNRLGALFPDPAWRIDRVDNAKRRLVGWVKRLKKSNGLDQVDLEAFFVSIARGSREHLHEFGADYRTPRVLS